MFYQIHRIGNILKGIFICIVVVITINYHDYTVVSTVGTQNYDLFSAVIISIGFGLSFCMLKYMNKKE